MIKESVDKLVIKRSEWTGVNPRDGSALLTNNGKKCCLGFYALACNALPEDIKGYWYITAATAVSASTKDKDLFNIELSDSFQYEAARINDSDLPLPEKEQQIIDLFKTVNCEVTFVD